MMKTKTKKALSKPKTKTKKANPAKSVCIPPSLNGNEVFHVEKGSYFNRSNDRFRVDENGNLSGRYLLMYSAPKVWRGEIAQGLLVDATADFPALNTNGEKISVRDRIETSDEVKAAPVPGGKNHESKPKSEPGQPKSGEEPEIPNGGKNNE